MHYWEFPKSCNYNFIMLAQLSYPNHILLCVV